MPHTNSPVAYCSYQILTSVGRIETNRLYCGCVVCSIKTLPTDKRLQRYFPSPLLRSY